MKTTIDAAGRIVVPKALRDELGVKAGQTLDLEVRDGRLEVLPAELSQQRIFDDVVVVKILDRCRDRDYVAPGRSRREPRMLASA